MDALGSAKDSILASQQHIATNSTILESIADTCGDFVYTSQRLQTWLEVAHVGVGLLEGHILSLMSDRVAETTQIVQRHTPAFGHLVDDKKFLVSLVKRNLLEHPSRGTLPLESARLYKETCTFKQIYGTFNVGDRPNGTRASLMW